MVSQKYRGSCIGAALAKWLTKNTIASQKMALKEKMKDGALEILLEFELSLGHNRFDRFWIFNRGAKPFSISDVALRVNYDL